MADSCFNGLTDLTSADPTVTLAANRGLGRMFDTSQAKEFALAHWLTAGQPGGRAYGGKKVSHRSCLHLRTCGGLSVNVYRRPRPSHVIAKSAHGRARQASVWPELARSALSEVSL